MAKQRRSAVRSSYLPFALMAVTGLCMLGVTVGLVAWSLGAFEGDTSGATVDRTGQLAFPAIVRPMGAYEAITKDDFINPRTNQLNVVWLPEATAQVASRTMSDLIGRVLKRDKQAGMVLTEADFMEKGTRPGLVAGIPSGKFAMTVPATEIPGLEQLRGGDRFDLLVSLPMLDADEQLSNSEPAALFGGIKPPSLQVSQLSRRHGVKHLVTDGMLVALFRGEKRSTNGPIGVTVAPRANTRSTTPPETLFAELAVDPEEIGPLTEAISLATKMTCVLRSGLPGGHVGDAISTEGMIPVITTAMPVQAFSALTDENLMDESTGRLHYYYFPPDKVSPEWLTEPAQLYGRVVGRQLRRGSMITESDLLPPGTRPGISAGLPAGMAGMSLAKANVQGFENLAVGDTFSILTRVPGEVVASSPSTTWATLQGGQLPEDDARIAEMVRTGIREVVRDAIFLSESAGNNVIIGIPELDVAKLAQLVRDNVEVFAVARSTQQSRVNAPSPPALLDEANNAIRLPSTQALRGRTAGDVGADLKGEERNVKLESQDSNFTLQNSNFPSPSPPAPLAEAGRGEQESSSFHLPDLARVASAQTLVNQNQHADQFEQPVREGNKVSVPILARDVPAYKAITIEDLVDSTTGRLKTLLFDPANVRDDWELDVRNLIDRVVIRPIQAGRPLRSLDLAPAGTIPGPAIGLEPGMRGVTVSADQIIGLESLPIGSLFDLVAARGVEVNSLADSVRPSITSSDAVKEATKLPGGRVATSRTVASQVKLLTNLGTIQVVVPRPGSVTQQQSQTSLTADGSTITETVISEPITYEERTVSQFVLAVPEVFVGTVLGLLDRNDPLQVSLRPANETPSQADSRSRHRVVDSPVRAVIQQHVRGAEISSEVFLTDRPKTLATYASENATGASASEGR